jgi:hypothetical protein
MQQQSQSNKAISSGDRQELIISPLLTPTSGKPSKLSFLDLPGEIRDKVYHYTLDNVYRKILPPEDSESEIIYHFTLSQAIHIDLTEELKFSEPMSLSISNKMQYVSIHVLLRELATCKILGLNEQITREAESYFFDTYLLRFLFALGTVVISRPEHLDNGFLSLSKCNLHRLHLRLELDYNIMPRAMISHIVETIVEADRVDGIGGWEKQSTKLKRWPPFSGNISGEGECVVWRYNF